MTAASTTDGLPIAPSMGPALENVAAPRHATLVDKRVALISGLAILVALAAGLVAQILAALIALITNIAFHQKFAAGPASPVGHHLGLWVIAVPVVGAVLVGFMARYGSKAIRGHGIPEAMEQVLFNQSRIPVRITFLKPLSAAIAIGTGGPFGAEGPIIATGGAMGSVLGQIIKVTADERKTLLAAGAAAGMAATFGSPVSAVLLAIELLLFEYRARSVIPVALAASTATAVRMAFVGGAPVFPLPEVIPPGSTALTTYIAVGAVLGIVSVWVTRLVYAIEDGFEKIPVHWMWWPAIGAVAVGVVGYFAPRTLGVGYINIEDTIHGDLAGRALVVLCVMKLVSWSIALGSGTSGGTLAPLFTIGGAIGALLTAVLAHIFPGHGIDPRIGALVGMAAIFAGASRALLASVVFAFETTRQPIGLLPLLGGCAAAYFVSCLTMPNSIMTEKLARRGVRVTSEYAVDFLDGLLVRDHAARDVVTLEASTTIADAREFLASGTADAGHQGYPIISNGKLVGVLTRRDMLDPNHDRGAALRTLIRKQPIYVHPENSLREAADHMVKAKVGRVIVVPTDDPTKIVGIVTRGDLLGAHERRLDATNKAELMIAPRVRLPRMPWKRAAT